jgi:voltage-gated sodium channel
LRQAGACTLDRKGQPRHLRARSLGAKLVKARLAVLLSDKRTETVITLLIIANAVTLGLETIPAAMAAVGPALMMLDRLFLAIFVAELAARLWVHGLRFFRDGWNVFDFAIIAIALLPASGPLAVLRALRVLRVLRLITVLPSLKRVVGAMIAALPGMGSIVLLLVLVIYVSAVMATKLFAASFPEQFGDLGRTAFTLFQLMTLDGWSGEVVRPVMAAYPLAWMFFIPFILLSAFVALNLFIGVVVNAMQSEAESAARAAEVSQASVLEELLAEVRSLRAELLARRGDEEGNGGDVDQSGGARRG